MAYPYAVGDKLLASEYNEVIKAAGLYAADAGSNDTYAITLTPAPSSYVTGMVFRFKANTVNTGAATLNVNSLGAKSILRPDGSALADGDIAAGQIVTVVYNGTNMLMNSPLANSPKFSHGVTTRAGDAASGTQNIAHGLGRAPRFIRIKAAKANSAGSFWSISEGSYDGTTTSCLVTNYDEATAVYFNTETTSIIFIGDSGGTANRQSATVTVDATNIVLTWTKLSTPSSDTIAIRWEAEA